jgi:hypothetical protein
MIVEGGVLWIGLRLGFGFGVERKERREKSDGRLEDVSRERNCAF